MRKNILSSIITNLLLLTFVIVWIIPTVGLFVSSFRDKDLLATSGWWTSFKTNQINEIYRTKTSKDQIEKDGIFLIKGNLIEKNSGKKVISYGLTSKEMNKYSVNETAILKNETDIIADKVFSDNSGKFVFSANEAYLIKNGKIDRPIKGAMLIGDGPSALNQVSMLADDLALDPGIGNCGKDGQTVPVNVGQPTMKIENLTVGGTA